MSKYEFTSDKTEDLEKALGLYSQLSDLKLMCIPEMFLIGIIAELNNRGIEVNWTDYFE